MDKIDILKIAEKGPVEVIAELRGTITTAIVHFYDGRLFLEQDIYEGNYGPDLETYAYSWEFRQDAPGVFSDEVKILAVGNTINDTTILLTVNSGKVDILAVNTNYVREFTNIPISSLGRSLLDIICQTE